MRIKKLFPEHVMVEKSVENLHAARMHSRRNICIFVYMKHLRFFDRTDRLIAFFAFLLVLTAFGCKVNHYVESTHSTYRMNEAVVSGLDAEISQLIIPYRAQLQAEMDEVIGQVGMELSKKQPESTLGNWFADMLWIQGQTKDQEAIDFAVYNYGGIRIPFLPQGEITKGKVFELMPFDNMVVILNLTGNEVQTLFNHIAQKGGWPVSKGVNFSVKNGQATGIMIHQKPLEPERTYRIVTSDYIANGGDQCSFLIDAPRKETGIILRAMIIEYIEGQTASGNALNSQIEQRIVQSTGK